MSNCQIVLKPDTVTTTMTTTTTPPPLPLPPPPNGSPRKVSSGGKLNQDKLFDPSIDMMVNDFDDERTLEEEEALAAADPEDANNELSSLQREGDMPLDELLALYGYGNGNGNGNSNGNQHEPTEIEPMSEPTPEPIESPITTDDTKMQLIPSKLQQLYDTLPEIDQEQDGSRLLRLSRVHSDEEDDDYDYSPDEDEWKKTIMVGSDYQASIPEGLSNYDDALPYENEDKLLWDPNPFIEDQAEDYLKRAINSGTGICALPKGQQLKDDEQALFLLLQCGHNVEEALRRRRMHSVPSSDTMSLWSEEECRNFESGLRCYGKDFHMIQQHKVRTRSVGELVQFYYLWKKTERHDVFANKTRLEKKKYTLHPGLTDFMDRFLEEQDGARDRSSSPNVQSATNLSEVHKKTPNSLTHLAITTAVTTTANTTAAVVMTTALNTSAVTETTSLLTQPIPAIIFDNTEVSLMDLL